MAEDIKKLDMKATFPCLFSLFSLFARKDFSLFKHRISSSEEGARKMVGKPTAL